MNDAPADAPSWLRYAVYLIQAVGFPIVVAGWFLYKLNGKLSALVDAMREVSGAFRDVKGDLAKHTEWSKDAAAELRRDLQGRHR